MPAAAFDLESTGTDVFTDRIVTGCLPRIDGSDIHCKRWLADPGIPIPAEATEVHGISTEYAQKYGRPHAEVVRETVDALYACWAEGRYVAVYNGSFDFSLLATYAPDFEVRGLIVDVRVLDQQFDRFRKGRRKLVDVCGHYGVRLDNAHDAEADSIAAARLAWRLPRVYPQLAEYTVDELMTKQAAWHRDRQLSFIEYLEKQGKPYTDVSIQWPIRTQRAQAA
jgi:DNA polymerase III epsilon subunit-like protein